MTEQEWLDCADPTPMLTFMQGKLSDRKLLLFAAACCRRGRSRIRGRTTLAALEALEAYADGSISLEEMEEQRNNWFQRFDYPFPLPGTWNAAIAFATKTQTPVMADKAAEHAATASRNSAKEKALQAGYVRDIAGNPFRRSLNEESSRNWVDEEILKLTDAIYEARNFGSLPNLADALERADCNDTAILEHCRQPTAHIRGCWVVDLILNKK